MLVELARRGVVRRTGDRRKPWTPRNGYVESMTIYPSRESSLQGTGRSLG